MCLCKVAVAVRDQEHSCVLCCETPPGITGKFRSPDGSMSLQPGKLMVKLEEAAPDLTAHSNGKLASVLGAFFVASLRMNILDFLMIFFPFSWRETTICFLTLRREQQWLAARQPDKQCDPRWRICMPGPSVPLYDSQTRITQRMIFLLLQIHPSGQMSPSYQRVKLGVQARRLTHGTLLSLTHLHTHGAKFTPRIFLRKTERSQMLSNIIPLRAQAAHAHVHTYA